MLQLGMPQMIMSKREDSEPDSVGSSSSSSEANYSVYLRLNIHYDKARR